MRCMPDKTLLEAAEASLTKLFAAKIYAARVEGLLASCAVADECSLSYFRKHLDEAPKGVAFGLTWVLAHADTRDKLDTAADPLIVKNSLLWVQLDALHAAYVEPGRIPPGGCLSLLNECACPNRDVGRTNEPLPTFLSLLL